MSLLLSLCSGCALPGHKLLSQWSLPVPYPFIPPSLSSYWCGFCYFKELDQLPQTADNLQTGTREKVRAQLSVGESRKILLWAARSCCVTSLISSEPTWSLFSLSVAERSSSISLLPVLDPLLPNPLWLRAKLIYCGQVKTCNLCPGAAGEDWGCACQLPLGRWPLWALLVAAPVPIDCWSGRDPVGTC